MQDRVGSFLSYDKLEKNLVSPVGKTCLVLQSCSVFHCPGLNKYFKRDHQCFCSEELEMWKLTVKSNLKLSLLQTKIERECSFSLAANDICFRKFYFANI